MTSHSHNHHHQQRQHAIVCFYHSNINVSLVNPSICTHIVYTSLGIDADGNICFPFSEDMQVFSELSFLDKMRKANENLKVLISIGDKDENQRRAFNAMLSSSHSRKNFARNIVNFCKRINFDGIDLSWQRPHSQHSKAFSDVLRRIKEHLHGVFTHDKSMPSAFDVFRFENNAEPQLLSATLNAGSCGVYDVKTIARKVKFINLMNFDMHEPAVEFSEVDLTVKAWMSHGAPVGKLHLGIATYEGCNDVRSVEERASYALFGELHGVAIHAFDGDDYTRGFPLIRAARDIFERHK